MEVPGDLKTTLMTIASMTDAEFEALRDEFDKIPPSLDTDTLKAAADAPDGSPIADLLFAIDHARRDIGLPLKRFVEGITGDPDTWKDADTRPDSQVVTDRILVLLKTAGISASLRGLGLLYEYERVFLTARIVSDIRPVFDPDSAKCTGMLIVHNLRITTRESGERRKRYFAMDSKDLASLKKAIERAEEKATVLREKITCTEVPFMASE